MIKKRKTKGVVPVRKILVVGFGNPARGDDGIGPEVIQELEKLKFDRLSVDSDYQLTVEHAADAADHDVVIFVDASVDTEAPFTYKRIEPKMAESFSSHSVSPEHVLGLADELFQAKPEGFMLAIRGYSFEMFDEALTEAAAINMKKAFSFLVSVIDDLHKNEISGGMT